jgi:hypothetical protein
MCRNYCIPYDFWQWQFFYYWDDCHLELIPSPISAPSSVQTRGAGAPARAPRQYPQRERVGEGLCVVCVRGTARPNWHTLALSRGTPGKVPTASCPRRSPLLYSAPPAVLESWRLFLAYAVAKRILGVNCRLAQISESCERKKSAETCNSVKVSYFCTTNS